jgi:predicted GNAT family acetyltransferase
MNPHTPTVVDDERNHRFLHVEDGVEAPLIYRARPGKLILIHTEVPESLAGRGIAGRFVSAALERARTTKETVLPWCPYARKWLSEHPDFAAGITIDWSDPPP